MTHSLYILTDQLKKRLEKTGKALQCRACGVALEVGQKIHSRQNKSNIKYYHLECYEKLFIEC